MIFFLRSAPISTDARMQKFLNVLATHHVRHSVICWDREDQIEAQDNIICYKKKSEHGARFRNLLKIIGWNFFIFTKLLKFRHLIKTVHAVDFDTALPAFIFCKVFNKKIIFDIYDKYTDSRSVKGLLAKIIDYLERYVLKKSNLGILVSSQRLKQHNIEKLENIEVIENVPVNVHVPICRENDDNLKLSYVGGLEKETRNLEFLIQLAIEMPDVIIDIAGYGPLTEFFEFHSSKMNNVNFHGKVLYSFGLEIMAKSDLILGMYNLKVPNHKYASPNKYYEHLFLGKPLITTKNTPPGVMVELENTGFTINDDFQEFKNLIQKIKDNKDNLFLLGENASNLWNKKYSNYYNDVFINIYLRKVKEYAS